MSSDFYWLCAMAMPSNGMDFCHRHDNKWKSYRLYNQRIPRSLHVSMNALMFDHFVHRKNSQLICIASNIGEQTLPSERVANKNQNNKKEMASLLLCAARCVPKSGRQKYHEKS